METLGQKRIRITGFEKPIILEIKKSYKELIDDINFYKELLKKDNLDLQKEKLDEINRLFALATTSIEESSMWAEKALTTVE